MAQLTKIQFRRDTAANWTTSNPTLANGELGWEQDTKTFKIGDGSTAWTSLGYGAITTAQGDTRYALASAVGSTIATLVAGKIPASQLPAVKLVNVATVANQTARLALATDDDAQLILQSDTNVVWMLGAGQNPATAGNWVAMPQPSLSGVELQSNKNAASGYAGLDSSGHIQAAQLATVDGGSA